MFNTITGMRTFSGTLAVCLYVITYPILKRYSIQGQNFILKMAVFFYLVPIAELKYCLWDIIEHIPLLNRYIVPYIAKERPFIEKFNVIIKFENGVVKFSSDLRDLFLILICAGLVSLIIFIWKFRKYQKMKYIFLTCSDELPKGKLEEQYLRLKEELQVHSDIKILGCKYQKSSSVIGFLSPVIIFPTETADINSQEFIMKHELLHVKHKDLIVRLLAIAVIVIHWFNPVAYCLFYELIMVSEMICDKGVLSGCLESDRKKYSELIVDLATVETNECVVGLADEFSVKRRVLEMKRVRKKNIFVSGAIAVVIGLSVSMSAFALYNPSRIIEKDGSYNPNTTVEFTNNEDYYGIEIESMPYEYFFTSEEGKIIPLSKDVPDRVICAHTTTESGGLTQHEKNNVTGGCVVTNYRVIKCSKCHKILEKTMTSQATFVVCPH